MIETERLNLRAWRDADRDPFWAMAQDEDVMRYLLPRSSREESDAVVDHLIAAQEACGHCFWAVERKDDARFIGFCGLMPANGPLSEIEIGWRLERVSWGKGYAREAALASLDWAWRDTATPTVVAITVIENIRSWGLMERLGMRRDPSEDFDHPLLAEGHPLRRHILYRIHRP
ncbi:MAG TPA: GNAT family N-acetyltransferase [Novosphingobium sp.]|nr:GNAT family N-acetyltransferase [Novosphingobium sp.]